MDRILERLGTLAIIPVIEIARAESSVPLGQALLDGGLPCAEITFRTAAAEDAIRRMTSTFSDMIIGAGTILTIDQAQKAIKAGAQFIVSPGLNPRIVDWCLEHDVPVTPGVATPTEIGMALEQGLSILKFFPAEAFGGIGTLKAIAAPYSGVRFIPTGGISPQNLGDYLKLPMVHACGGSWLAPGKLISNGAFHEIARLTQEAVALVGQYRDKEKNS